MKPERFFARRVLAFYSKYIEKTASECWIWNGSCFMNGYGQFRFKFTHKTETKAHRVAWVLENGPIEDGKIACHKCDNKRCVNPAHIFIGSNQDNMSDMVSKGRSASGDRSPSRIHPEIRKRGEEATFAKLTAEDVIFIRKFCKLARHNFNEIGRAYGISGVAVRNVAIGKAWKHIR